MHHLFAMTLLFTALLLGTTAHAATPSLNNGCIKSRLTIKSMEKIYLKPPPYAILQTNYRPV
ncbi:hypothetical protein [Moraxella sp.]|uniref:hypothetical protein n=1 Tax=Moraxella sp. TaxID=479 RepID=UPI0026DB1F44|nr:hypothetical protein [Moraxella sp.]MDO4895351.1 hypothetical protein [Moraxella sp.]